VVPPSRRPRALIALSDARERSSLALELERTGWDVAHPPVAPNADWDVVFAEADAPRPEAGSAALVLVSSFGSVADAVRAVQSGAFDFVVRPASGEQLALCAERARERADLAAENSALRRSLSERYALGRLVTRDPRLRRVLELVEQVAPSRASVLIEGESGTGKTLLARALHERSDRAAGPFVVVNCGALPGGLLESELFGYARGAFTGAVRDKPGRFEEAHGGTLFLDEISTASVELQVKLLRAIQERVIERLGSNESVAVDVRFVFASNVDLAAAVRAGSFREDLFWRIRVVALSLPPLRERSGDVALLAQAFLERFRDEYGKAGLELSPAALASLCRSSWPGNVRQLENTLERAVLVARGARIEPGDLSADPLAGEPDEPEPGREVSYGPFAPGQPAPSLREALAGPERSILLQALEHCGWNRQATAAMLGINRTTLFNKMHKYGLFGLDPAAAGSGKEAG
jgi:two-component system response regulator AtoC